MHVILQVHLYSCLVFLFLFFVFAFLSNVLEGKSEDDFFVVVTLATHFASTTTGSTSGSAQIAARLAPSAHDIGDVGTKCERGLGCAEY